MDLHEFISSDEIRDQDGLDAFMDEAFDILDEMRIDIASFEFIKDDAHADPESYIMKSPSFRATNPQMNDTSIDFYEKWNNDEIIITRRMIMEMIEWQMIDIRDQMNRGCIIVGNHFSKIN